MESLAATKLEPKIENKESSSSVDSNDVVRFENQPSSSASLNTSTVTSSATRINNFDSDSDDSIVDIIDTVNPQPAEQVLEVVDIDTSEEEKEEDKTIQIPRKAGLRQLTKRCFFKVKSFFIICYCLTYL